MTNVPEYHSISDAYAKGLENGKALSDADNAATVAELRAEVERRKDALAAMSQFAKVAEQRADAAERRAGELEALLAAIRLYAQHDDACGDMDAYNNATIESCGCGLDSLLDAASEVLTGADPT